MDQNRAISSGNTKGVVGSVCVGPCYSAVLYSLVGSAVGRVCIPKLIVIAPYKHLFLSQITLNCKSKFVGAGLVSARDESEINL